MSIAEQLKGLQLSLHERIFGYKSPSVPFKSSFEARDTAVNAHLAETDSLEITKANLGVVFVLGALYLAFPEQAKHLLQSHPLAISGGLGTLSTATIIHGVRLFKAHSDIPILDKAINGLQYHESGKYRADIFKQSYDLDCPLETAQAMDRIVTTIIEPGTEQASAQQEYLSVQAEDLFRDALVNTCTLTPPKLFVFLHTQAQERRSAEIKLQQYAHAPLAQIPHEHDPLQPQQFMKLIEEAKQRAQAAKTVVGAAEKGFIGDKHFVAIRTPIVNGQLAFKDITDLRANYITNAKLDAQSAEYLAFVSAIALGYAKQCDEWGGDYNTRAFYLRKAIRQLCRFCVGYVGQKEQLNCEIIAQYASSQAKKYEGASESPDAKEKELNHKEAWKMISQLAEFFLQE